MAEKGTKMGERERDPQQQRERVVRERDRHGELGRKRPARTERLTETEKAFTKGERGKTARIWSLERDIPGETGRERRGRRERNRQGKREMEGETERESQRERKRVAETERRERQKHLKDGDTGRGRNRRI